MPAGVYVKSEEWKSKARIWLKNTQFKKGQSSWNKNKPYQIGQGRYARSEKELKVLRSNSFKKGNIPWNKGMTGSRAINWQGGKTSLTMNIRASEQYHKWRADVYKRDGWTCQTCGFRGHGKDIEAHHIIPMRELIKEAHMIQGSHDDKYIFALSIPKMFDISNGITLCKSCHILTFKGVGK